MRTRRFPPALAALILVMFVGACGGGGGGGGIEAITPTDPIDVSPTGSETEFETVVLHYDLNGDGDPDLVTVNLATDPYTIVSAIVATDGGMVDSTDTLAGLPIDRNLSTALGAYLAEAVDVASGQTLEVTGTDGRETTVVIYE